MKQREEVGDSVDFVGAIKAGFKNYTQFRGTATRPEFWYWVLFTSLVSIVTSFVDATGTIATAFSLATLLPTLGVTVRRLRDAGYSWVWILSPAVWLVPFFVGFAQFIQALRNLGFDQYTLENIETLDSTTIQSVIADDAVVGSLVIMGFSFAAVLVFSILVQIIFPAQKGKTFEEGNKRLAPKAPAI